MRKSLQSMFMCFGVLLTTQVVVEAQVVKIQDYVNKSSALIGTFQNINFHEAGFSGLYPIAGTNGTEFWTVSDRGVNVDAANANPSTCRPTYDKIYGFQNYAPKIHRIRVHGDSIQILQTITMKRPNGTGATGVLNPTGFGSTSTEQASTDTVLTCTNFPAKIAPKDVWGIDSEGIVVDKQGNFWICEEGGPTIWKLNSNGVVISRFTPYGNLAGIETQDIAIDTVFKYRKNNRGFESIAITPSGKIYALIQSPLLFPTKAIGEGTQVHRLLEIDPATNATKVFVYLNDGIIGASGANQIRLRDWKLSDMAAISDSTFLVVEAALRGTTDVKNIYKINITGATPVTSALYNGSTVEGLVNLAGLTANSIVPVKKTLFLDLFTVGWDPALEKAEGLAIINDSTIAICNDNDYGQFSPTENGVATATGIKSHLITYRLQGAKKLTNYKTLTTDLAQGRTGISTSTTPYITPSQPGVEITSILSVGDNIGGYKMVGIPDGLGAYDNGDGTFTVLMNHELGNTQGIARAHGSAGSFVSKWVIKKSDLSVQSGSDLMQNVKLWNGTDYTTYNAANPNALAAFGRFCSADLPEVSAFYNSATSLGTQERIFMNGEESGVEGRAMAHIATGTNAGTSYELPSLGKFAWENSVASPATGNKTVVAGMDDGTGGQVYIYVGTKTNTGTEVDKAGLTNGKLYGVKVTGLVTETSISIPAAGTAFTMFDLGDVKNMTGQTLENNSVAAGVTTFLRPEDGAWDPKKPNDFYFVTTNAFANPSRLWRLTFTDLSNPELGGTITAVLDGTEGQKMLDNIAIDNYGHVIMVEDVGGNAHIGKTWQYTIATDQLKQIASHDESRFLTGAPNFLTIDEEATGVMDMESILGKGMFLVADQAHYNIAGELVQGGQLLVFSNPDTKNSPAMISSGKIGVSTTQNPYMIPSQPGVEFTSLLSVGDNIGGYKMVGIPDGLGAYDNGDGTFTVLMNHELGNTQGIARAHGSAGAFVSKWVIKKSDLSVQSGSDLMQNVKLWNGTDYTTYNAANPNALAAFNRFCSADLPEVSAFYNSATSLGTQERIFMNGEEGGVEGRAMAHIATGTNAGTSYELPSLGKFAWENSVASPATGNKTVVAGMDDGTGGQVYIYVGTKTNTGTEVDKAGLTNGKLYGVKVAGLIMETSSGVPTAGTAFTMFDLGDVKNMTGQTLENNSVANGVTTFLRPEDGAWDPKKPNDFYFVTTNAFANPSRLWRLTFTDLSNPELGGTITAVLDGTEGQKMLDNIAIDNYGHVIMVEDVGGNAHIGKTWQYTIATDQLKQIASHDESRFLTGAPNFLTIDEEATGVMDMESILGKGMFLVADQAHYNIAGELVQGGQLLVFTNPDTKNSTTVSIGNTAPSTSQNPYMVPSQPGVEFTSILSVGDNIGGYKMVGIPDGLGAYDNGDGTFTVLMNHELGNTQGIARAHGSAGSFVSKWVIKKSDLSVQSGSDLMQNVKLWDGTTYVTYNAANPNALAAFGRFCSADLPEVSAFYNSATSLGTQERIFMNGEESGVEGRAMAHIATGTNAGTSYELPSLGKFAWENSVASPTVGNKTIVAGMDDGTGGQVYIYVGTKTNTGTEVDKAGLTNGKLYGVKVTGLIMETSSGVPTAGTAFTMFDLGDVKNMTGQTLENNSVANGVTTFLRPEDGAWDPKKPNDFYFVTTNAFANPSRLWRLTFTDLSNPELGGTITAVLDGTEGQKMLDNIAIDNYGHVIMVEDVGGNAHIGKTWQYTIATDELKEIASHDASRFLTGAPNFLTIDEEATGVIDMESILGKGMFLVADQAHYNIPGELVQGGQLLVFTNPDTKNATPLTTGILDEVNTNANIRLYPNPMNNTATVSLILDNNEQVTVAVYDVQGKEVLPSVKENLESGEQNILLNTSSLSNGTYIVEITTETYSQKIRIVVMH